MRRNDRSHLIQCEGETAGRRCIRPHGHAGQCADTLSYPPPAHFVQESKRYESHTF